MPRPDPELKRWSKNDLVREVERLRAIAFEHAEVPGDVPPVGDGGSMVDVAGDPYARGGVVMDARNAVLVDHIDVCLVDSAREGAPLIVAMQLAGRVNRQDRRAQQLFMLNEDGAAGVVSELVALSVRIGPEFAQRLMARLEAMP